MLKLCFALLDSNEHFVTRYELYLVLLRDPKNVRKVYPIIDRA